MPSVVLQQVSSKYARSNAGKTLDKPIALKYVKQLPPEEFQKLEAVCTDGQVYVWGSKFERVHQYGKIPPRHSLVLFRKGAEVYKCGIVLQWLFNPELAERLWGFDSDNETWSLVFFLKDVKDFSVAASEINKLIGRKPADNWQGLTAITSTKAEKVIEFVKAKLERSNNAVQGTLQTTARP